MKSFFLTTSLALVVMICHAQVIKSKQILISNQQITGNVIYQASEKVQVKPSTKITASSGQSQTLKINPYQITDEEMVLAQKPVNRELDPNLPVGSIPGSWSVSDMGGFSYNFSIGIPVGTNGMAPSFAVYYNSQNQRGLLGQGWDLSGLSEISLRPRTEFYDGYDKQLVGTAADGYALDGNPLVLINGENAADLSEYRTVSETFSKIVAHENEGNGPRWFEVFTKDGKIIQYGNTADSRYPLVGKTSNGATTFIVGKWLINKVTDRYGNYIEYKYTSPSKGELLIDEVLYTGNSTLAKAPYNKIKFLYKDRKDSRRINMLSFCDGCDVIDSKIIDKIQVFTESVLTSEYKFGYDTQWIRDRLISVTLCDGVGNCLNPTIFKWDDSKINAGVVATTHQLASGDFRVVSGDYNGDGLADIIRIPVKTSYSVYDYASLWLGQLDNTFKLTHSTIVIGDVESFNASNVSVTADVPLGMRDLKSTDLDNDGFDEFIYFDDGSPTQSNPQGTFHFLSFNSAGTSYLEKISSHNTANKNLVAFTDFDNDGRIEIVDCHNSQITIRKVDGSVVYVTAHNNVNIIRAKAVDNNYDGALDLLYEGNTNINTETWALVYNKLTASYEYATANNAFESYTPSSPFYFQFADANGDGYADKYTFRQDGISVDLIGGQKGIIKNPAYPVDTYEGNKTAFPMDVNGDGLCDLIEVERLTGKTKVKYHLTNKVPSKTYNFYTTIEKELNFEANINKFSFGDFDGNGRQDLCYPQTDGQLLILHFDEAYNADKIVQAANGFNQTVNVDYTTFTKETASQPAESGSSLNYSFYRRPISLVRSIVYATDADYSYQRNTYAYDNLRFSNRNKSFLGFLKIVTKSSWSYKNESVYRLWDKEVQYAIDPTYDQLDHVVTKEFTNGTLAKSQSSNFSAVALGGSRFFKYCNKTSSTDHLTGITQHSVNTYDDNGNLLLNKVYDAGNLTESLTEYSNYVNAGSWMVNAPQNIKVTSSSNEDPNKFIDESLLEYYPEGKVKKMTRHVGKSQTSFTEFTYNTYGNVISTTAGGSDVVSRISSSIYDVNERLPVTSTNALGHIISTAYDYRWSKPTEVTDPNGNITTSLYDGFGRFISGSSSTGILTTSLQIWCRSEVEGALYKEVSQVGDMPPATVYYDFLNRPLQNSMVSFNGKTVNSTISYYPTGDSHILSQPFFAGTYPAGYSSFEYDGNGRLVKTNFPTGAKTESIYSGRSINQIDVGGRITYMEVDEAGRLQWIKDASGVTIEKDYSSTGGVSTIITGNKTITNEFDENGRMFKTTDPDAGAKQIFFNAFDEPIQSLDAKQQSYSMNYDQLGRVLTKTGPEGIYSYMYDTEPNGKGALALVTGPGGNSVKYSYDEKSRVKQQIEIIDGVPYTYAFEYDNYNRIVKKTYPTGYQLTYEYNQYGYISSIKNGAVALWSCLETDNFGNITSSIRGNNKVSTKNFDQQGLLTNYNTLGSSPGQFIQNWNVQISPYTGNLENRENLKYGLKESFTYDMLDRLVGTTYSGTSLPAQTITYDLTGRMDSKTDAGTKYNYTDPLHPTAVTEVENPQNIPSWNQSVTYNAFNKAITLTESPLQGPATELSFTYGADMQRKTSTLKRGSALLKSKVYAGEYEKEVLLTGQRELIYLNGPEGAIGFVETKNGASKLYYIYTDHLGSLDVITDNRGNLVEEHSFDAWGRRRNTSNWQYLPSKIAESDGYNFLLDRGYTGHEHHDQLGVINMNGRIYDPVVGRMLNADPFIRDENASMSYDRYAYCEGNPLKYTDPSGYHSVGVSGPQSTGEIQRPLSTGPDYYVDGVKVSTWEGRLMGGGAGSNGSSVGKVEVIGSASIGVIPIMQYYDPKMWANDNGIALSKSRTRGEGQYIDNVTSGNGVWYNPLNQKEYFDETAHALASWTTADELMYAAQDENGRLYGGDGSGSFMDNLCYAVDKVNQFNPIADAWDAVTGAMYGTDRFGNEQSAVETNIKALSILPIGKIGKITNGTRGVWKLTEGGATAIKNHSKWGNFYKGADGLWWSPDRAGHGSSAFKVFKEGSTGLEWVYNADMYGDFIKNQHKSTTGMFIPWGQLGTVK